MATDTGSGMGIDSDQLLAVVAGGFVGAIAVGLVLQAGLGREGVSQFGEVVGMDGYGVGWVVLFVLSGVFASLFVQFVSRSIDTFVNQTIMLSQRSDALKRLLVPLIRRSALTVTTNSLGLIYGLAIWIVFYMLAMPLWLEFVIGAGDVAVPNLGLSGLLAWLVYGAVVGLLYGLVLEA